MDGDHRDWMGTILTRKPLFCKRFGACWERLGSLAGGEGVSQLPLKDKAFLTFLSQNPPFELRPKTAFRLPSWPIQVRVPTFQFPSAVDCMVGWRLPAEGEGHTFDRVGRARPQME